MLNSIRRSQKMRTEYGPLDFSTFKSLVRNYFNGVMRTKLDWNSLRELRKRYLR